MLIFQPSMTKSSLSSRAPGGGDAGSLLPGVLPPELVASYARAWSDTPCRQSFVPQTPQPPQPPQERLGSGQHTLSHFRDL